MNDALVNMKCLTRFMTRPHYIINLYSYIYKFQVKLHFFVLYDELPPLPTEQEEVTEGYMEPIHEFKITNISY
jgi:hypothetical protein